ncbi:hypothetical protein P5V15_013048 [Pogonomyrmex californicus]
MEKTLCTTKKLSSENVQCSKTEAKDLYPILFKTNTIIKLFASRCRIRKTARTMAKISKYHILENKNKGRDICHKILSTYIGNNSENVFLNLDKVRLELSPILELFKNRHNRFNYFDNLKHIIAERSKKYARKGLQKNQIHPRLLLSFFSLILYKNVPLQLFGTLRNIKVIKKMIYSLLKTVPEKISISNAFKRKLRPTKATAASLNIQKFVQQLDIFKIKWLHSIDNNDGKMLIILKLLHWFLKQYIIKILHKYVVLTACKKKWIFISKDDWYKILIKFIEEKKKSHVPWTKLEKKRSIGTYTLISSSSSLRALFIARYNSKKEFETEVILRFLQQLYVTYFNKNGIPTVKGCINDINAFKSSISSTNNQLYFVSCDIQDAFGSILQEKLYNIINMCCKQLEEYLPIRTFILKTKGNKINKNTVRFVSLPSLNFMKSVVIPMQMKKPKLVRTKILMNKLYKLIYQQKVKFNSQVYSIRRGVPQGIRISSILSDIYYQHMINEKFAEYANNGLLRIYVDDIIYITKSDHYAKMFLEKIRNGIPEYNVTFNPDKIQSKTSPSKGPIKIKFLKQIITL